MARSAFKDLVHAGQSIWLDYISRDLLSSGELARLVAEDGVTGITTNPTIMQRAIAEGRLYDEEILDRICGGAEPVDVLDFLTLKDVRAGAELLSSRYERSKGADGYVSVELDPRLAYEREMSLDSARRLLSELAFPNIMVKVPGTRVGLRVFEELIAEGRKINVTLLFSIPRYRQVIAAYKRGLERFEKAGGDLSNIFSVASFFVSRIDTAVDRLIESKEKAAGIITRRNRLISLKGRAAIANARMAYRIYQEEFGESFAALAAKGARPQKLLWASTSTKNPAYLDVVYVEELIGPGTINTMTQDTLRAFKDHGRVRHSIDERPEEAEALVEELSQLGIDLEDVGDQLELDGVESFTASYVDAIETIRRKGEAGCTTHMAGRTAPG